MYKRQELSIDTNSDGSNDNSQSIGTTTNAKEYTISVDESSSGHLWVFGIEGTAVGIKPTQGATLEEFWEPRVPYDVNVRLTMGSGNHYVDENLTNYVDYACSTDGVNMNTPNQACISKLEFGEPSNTYNGTNFIEMNFNAFNLSRLDIQNDGIILKEESGFWNVRNATIIAGFGGFSIAMAAFVLWSRRPFVN